MEVMYNMYDYYELRQLSYLNNSDYEILTNNILIFNNIRKIPTYFQDFSLNYLFLLQFVFFCRGNSDRNRKDHTPIPCLVVLSNTYDTRHNMQTQSGFDIIKERHVYKFSVIWYHESGISLTQY